MGHKHKVEDTRLRSALKALTGNGLEVIFDTIIFGIVFVALGMEVSHAVGVGLGLSVLTEILCFITNYFNDRAWNRTQWGRKVKDINTSTTPLTDEELKAIREEIELFEKASIKDWIKFEKFMREKEQRYCLIESIKDMRKCRCPNMPEFRNDGKTHCIYARNEDGETIVGKYSICLYRTGEL